MKQIITCLLSCLFLFSLKAQTFKINSTDFEVGESFTSWDIQFVLAKAELQTSACKPTLDSITDFLKKNATTTVELGFHTNTRGTPEANLVLTQQRAEALKTYLATQGIEAQRMEVKGYGSSEPIISKEEEKKNSKAWNYCEPPNPPCHGNRRLTVKILKK